MKLLSILAPLVVFGLVIFVHELGHFLAAKSVGVYTPRFSIGFGPALWRRRKGETEYILAALPLGGYVRMASRHDEATAFLEGGSEAGAAVAQESPGYDPDAMIPFGPKPVPEDRWFESKPLWARLYILLAGVTMNVLLGLAVNVGLALHFGEAVLPTTVVAAVRPVAGKPVLSAAIQPGDTIRRVNEAPVRSWDEVIERITESRGRVLIETNRGSVTVPLDPDGASGATVARALDVYLPPVIGEVVPGEPAAKAGIAAGDSVIAIGGQPIRSWNEMVRGISSSAGIPTAITLMRGTESKTITVTPRTIDATDPVTGERAKVGRIGAAPKDISVREPVSFLNAVRVGVSTTKFMATAIIRTVRDLVTRRASVDELGGFIAITQASVQAARSGMESFFFLIALLSVNVAILNLLPIPVLDGGQVLLNVLESAKGRPFSARTREYILRAALVMILLLLVLTTYNDIRRLIRQFVG